MRIVFAAALVATTVLSSTAVQAAQCGNDTSGFAAWKQAFAQEASAAGVGTAGLQALANAQYSTSTIRADRNQTGVR
jgi:membrane-bound lytic murein transglycosylase B